MTDRIDHAAEARKHIDWAHDQQGRDGEYDSSVRDNAILAQAAATLALVEQQRIANLIALSVPPQFGAEGSSVRIPSYTLDGVLREDIAEGLGI